MPKLCEYGQEHQRHIDAIFCKINKLVSLDMFYRLIALLVTILILMGTGVIWNKAEKASNESVNQFRQEQRIDNKEILDSINKLNIIVARMEIKVINQDKSDIYTGYKKDIYATCENSSTCIDK